MIKQTVTYQPTMEYYSATKRKKLLIHATTWISQWSYAKWKKPILKVHILYDSIYNILK